MPTEPSVDARDLAQIPDSRLGRGCLQQLPGKRTVSQIGPPTAADESLYGHLMRLLLIDLVTLPIDDLSPQQWNSHPGQNLHSRSTARAPTARTPGDVRRHAALAVIDACGNKGLSGLVLMIGEINGFDFFH